MELVGISMRIAIEIKEIKITVVVNNLKIVFDKFTKDSFIYANQ
jgi:hypothetical protein